MKDISVPGVLTGPEVGIGKNFSKWDRVELQERYENDTDLILIYEELKYFFNINADTVKIAVAFDNMIGQACIPLDL